MSLCVFMLMLQFFSVVNEDYCTQSLLLFKQALTRTPFTSPPVPHTSYNAFGRVGLKNVLGLPNW